MVSRQPVFGGGHCQGAAGARLLKNASLVEAALTGTAVCMCFVVEAKRLVLDSGNFSDTFNRNYSSNYGARSVDAGRAEP